MFFRAVLITSVSATVTAGWEWPSNKSPNVTCKDPEGPVDPQVDSGNWVQDTAPKDIKTYLVVI